MNLLYCGDANVQGGILLSALSVARHTRGTLHVYVLTASVTGHEAIPPAFEDVLRAAIARHNEDARVTLLDISEEFSSYLPTANMGTRFTPLCMLRLFADRVATLPDKLLYLDADVLCRGDLAPLWQTDMGDAEIAGVPDRYGKWFYGNVLRHSYLNSGVLLMNMRAIRASGLFEKCRARCRDKKMFLPDQSALNALATKKKLPRRYNEQGAIRENTLLKHFTTFFKFFPYVRAVTIKPWHEERMHEELGIFEFDDILEEWKHAKK